MKYEVRIREDGPSYPYKTLDTLFRALDMVDALRRSGYHSFVVAKEESEDTNEQSTS